MAWRGRGGGVQNNELVIKKGRERCVVFIFVWIFRGQSPLREFLIIYLVSLKDWFNFCFIFMVFLYLSYIYKTKKVYICIPSMAHLNSPIITFKIIVLQLLTCRPHHWKIRSKFAPFFYLQVLANNLCHLTCQKTFIEHGQNYCQLIQNLFVCFHN